MRNVLILLPMLPVPHFFAQECLPIIVMHLHARAVDWAGPRDIEKYETD